MYVYRFQEGTDGGEAADLRQSAQQRRLEQSEKAATGWCQDVAEKEIALMRNPQTVQEARNLAASGAGKKYMDGLGGLVKEVIDVEAALLQTQPRPLWRRRRPRSWWVAPSWR